MRIISFKICPFVQRVTALLEATEIPYTVEYISLSNKPDWFLALSPHGQVPILVTDAGEVLHESDAIAEYIAERTGRSLFSEDPARRAQDRAWAYLATKNYLTQCSTQRSPDAETLEQRSARLHKAFAAIEEILGEGPFFRGDSLGMVDLTWLPLLHRAAIVKAHSGYDFLADYPKLRAWQRRLLETGLAERSVAEDFEQAFVDFYLSKQTYLGQLA